MSSAGETTNEYRSRTGTSEELYQRALAVFPSGVTHDSRYLRPHPVFIDRAQGSRKWDVDGVEYVDYFGGHGALILGHNHPAVVEAVVEQLSRGTHYGASHRLELEWAEQIIRMVPCAEKVRFTGSGTEATQLGFRLARAATGKKKILRFAGHFHGWHDQVAFGPIADSSDLPGGIPAEFANLVTICPPNDLEAVAEQLSSDDEIAAVVLEPTGATFGHVPTIDDFPAQLRALTKKHGVLLIFDEVICGFRVARGGAQEHYGVTPDLSFLAKIVAGGYPGGAVVGRADLLDGMGMTSDPEWNARGRVAHQGTFNANPVSAAAGLAALHLVATTDVIEKANRTAADIRDGMNSVVAELGQNWLVYGEFSDFHVCANEQGLELSLEDLYGGRVPAAALRGSTEVMHGLRTGMLANGTDIISWPGGLVSAVHTEADVERTVSSFRHALEQMLAPTAAG